MPERAAELDHRRLRQPADREPTRPGEEPLTIERADGTSLVDSRGRRYIDGASSLGCNVHGHRHPRIDAAVRDQLGRVAHSTVPGAAGAAAELGGRLAELAPPGLDRVLYSGSGSDATRIAVELAYRHWQQRGGQHRRRTSFVTLRGGRHDAGVAAMPGGGAGPLDGIDGPRTSRAHRVEPGDSDQLERVLDRHQEEIAAVIVEPLVEIAAGVRVHPPGYLRRVREVCDRHEALLICDEVGTGFGRTGTMFGCEQERVAPDALCVGGTLAGGYLPLGATITTDRISAGLLDARAARRAGFEAGELTANTLACAAALANLEAFREESTLLRLQPKVRVLGELLEPIAAMPEVAEVRGRGFAVGIDLGPHDPALRIGDRVALEARARGAIVRALGDVIVLLPPLTISSADLSRLVAIAGESIRAAAGAGAGGPVRPATVDHVTRQAA